ncbi:hypothetical protein PENARI_c011G05378 [Penicillium arizonense]|uniref:Rhodopsin domain-containing protein n=1 Tax=Penicillium arizonense TaxID=1835702 RepID=A0A1F5LFT5_PENAI|nr:hypothetical protein PENARI_c011G05378 [Penicillium arizonense]OGE52005.1 hypothetical protein PENARI_c011G05378 [Penicillium arizonense]
MSTSRLAAIQVPPKPWLRTANRILASVGIGLSTGLLILRIYVKTRLMRKFWWDDILLILAWVFALGTQAVILWGYIHAGFGVHVSNLTLPVMSIYQKTVLAAAIIYVPALALAKLSLLMLYYRLLYTVRMWQYVIFLVAFLISGYSIALTLALIFACHPLQKNWDASISTGSCINRDGVYLATAITNTVSDVVLILIPISVVRKLRMPLIQKIGVICMFGIGCLNIEASFIIICGCLPYVRQFLRHHPVRYPGRQSRNRDLERSPPKCLRQRKMQRTGLSDHIEMATDEANGNDDDNPPENRNEFGQ